MLFQDITQAANRLSLELTGLETVHLVIVLAAAGLGVAFAVFGGNQPEQAREARDRERATSLMLHNL